MYFNQFTMIFWIIKGICIHYRNLGKMKKAPRRTWGFLLIAETPLSLYFIRAVVSGYSSVVNVTKFMWETSQGSATLVQSWFQSQRWLHRSQKLGPLYPCKQFWHRHTLRTSGHQRTTMPFPAFLPFITVKCSDSSSTLMKLTGGFVWVTSSSLAH